jgi:hypothetical protein
VTKVHRNYHIPISNTATGLLALDNAAFCHDAGRKLFFV